MRNILILTIALALLVFTFSNSKDNHKGVHKMNIKLTSTAFEEGGMIPKIYTCDGKNISPPLTWTNLPAGTKSIALISDDPDAPMGTWVHWVIYNIPPTDTGLNEAIQAQNVLSNGTKQGTTSFKRVGYGGPCPPSGTHRYFFKLYALDKILELDAGATKDQLLTAMENHILDTGQLIGKFKR